MHAQKISISLPPNQCEFIRHYQSAHHYKTRSEVVREAISLLQQSQLEACYREANQEVDEAFDMTTSDGIEKNETW